MSHLNGIALQSDETHLSNLRAGLRKMTDDELIAFGRMVRGLSAPRVSVTLAPGRCSYSLRERSGDEGIRRDSSRLRVPSRP